MLRSSLALAAALALAPLAASAQQSPVNGSLGVSSTVAYSCVVNSLGALNFGSYDPADVNGPGGSPLRTTSQISIRCTKGTNNAPIVTFGAGQNGNEGATAQRNLISGAGEKLRYRLFGDSAYTNEIKSSVVEDEGAGIEFLLDPSSTNSTVEATLYGQVDAGQNVAAGDYTDTMLVTLTF